MSIKKFFDQSSDSRKYLTETDKKEAFKDIESSRNLRQQRIKQDSLLPQVDYIDPANFAKFGSAYMYYKGAIERIIDYYPYDGSDAEITSFYNKSLPIEKYIFNRMYPRTNGYVSLNKAGYGSTSLSSDGYGQPTNYEYITFYGGPNITTSLTKLKDMEPNSLSSKFQYNNIYDTDIYDTEGLKSDYGKGTRESNLKSNFDTGVTVEFWIKTGSLGSSFGTKQVVFDMWNNEETSSADYGRITLELTSGAGAGNPFLITAQSGTVSASAQFCFTSSIGQNLSASDLSEWGHYALTMYNSGTSFVADLHVNGYLNDSNIYSGTTLGELNSKNMVARLGGLVTKPSGSSAVAGSGKLSGSLDEFRFWKVSRSGADIGKNWFEQIRGGVNSDISNAALGMYYKFNEGVTGQTELDSVVLDYGGRLCNGAWTGYTTTSRNSGSAMISASVAYREYEDPIIYAEHPAVMNLKAGLLATGSYHDQQNAGLVRNLLPSWLTDDTETSDQTDLDKLCHIMGAYFDKLHLLTGQLSSLKQVSYTSASAEPLPFAQHLPQHLGLYAPEIFVDSTILEKFKNRTDKEQFENDMSDAKNLIYSNIYNNLTSIYKAKGTEKAIRNVLRCFNLNDNLVRYNVYSNNQQFELKNNLKQTLKNKTYANFNTPAGSTAVIYQAENPHTSSRGYISGTNATGYEDRHGLTVETSIVFPRFLRSLDSVDRSFTNVSLYGMQTVNSASTSDTAFLTGGQDTANFQVIAVRDAVYSKNAYFMLTSSTEPYNFPTLTSSLFFDVYDDSNWNFSVKLKPSNYPIVDLVSGSSEYTYDVVFRGTNNNLGSTLNSFEITSSITKVKGQEILKAPKRIYVGAYGTNITGSNVHKSDVLVSSAKYWTKFIDNKTLDQHLFDAENYGVSGSYRYVSELDPNVKDTYNFNSLALNWYFGNVTSSDSAGNFYVTDLSSGSAENRNAFGWMGNISSYLHPGRGFRFDTDATSIVDIRNVNEFKFIDPEQAISSEMVQILDSDDEIFGITEQIPNYVYTIEKSLYAAVTEEILDFFAGAVDFHHLIGQPVNRYRGRYKAMEHLRRIFFEKVQDTATVEKFTEYYKWFDDAISIIIGQLVPASADFVSDTFNVVESHVLERNKYKSQFPTIEFRKPDPEPPILGIGELIQSYEQISTPLPSSPRKTNIKQDYWRQRAETTSQEITSGDVDIDTQRQTFKEVVWSTPHVSGAGLTVSNTAGIKYQENQRIASQRYATYLFDNKIMHDIKGGVNFTPGKRIGYTYDNLRPAGPVYAPSGGVYVPQNVLLAEIRDLVNEQQLELNDRASRKPNEKVKRIMKVQSGRNFEQGIGYTGIKSTVAFPFNIMSSSVHSGYNKFVSERVTSSIEIVNLHNDVYGDDMERPMQGAFSEYAVGGHQSRHVGLNIYDSDKSDVYNGLDNYTTRPEAWKLLLGNGSGSLSGAIGMAAPDYPWPEANEPDIAPYPMTASQKAVYYRDLTAKTPYVFKNIRMRTGSTMRSNTTVLGNYRNNYEIVHTVGAWNNPRQFIEIGGQPNLPTGAFPNTAKNATQIRTFLDIHREDDGRFPFIQDYNAGYLSGTENKSVIVSKFSNPGGLEVNPAGYGDFRSNEFSVYNATRYRNLTVLKPSQGPRGSISEVTGVGGPGIRVSDIHTMDYGLRSHLSRHTARFGRDSLIYPPDDLRIEYDLKNQFTGYGRIVSSSHGHYRAEASLQGWWRLNQDISSATSGDAIDSSGNGRDGTFAADANRPAFSTTLGPSKYVQSGSCTFDASDDSTNISTAAVWDAIIGNDTAGGSTEMMTFSAWIYKTGDGENSFGRIIDFGNSDIYFATYTSEQIYFTTKWDGDNAVQWKTPNNAFSLNEWVHLVVTYDATAAANLPKIYVNGIEQPVALASGTQTGAYYGIISQDAHIGNRSSGDRTFQGQLADVAVWNSVLTQEDVAALYSAAAGPGATERPLYAYGPGSADNGFREAPGYHKVHRNNRPRVRIATTTLSPNPNPLNCQNDRAAYWSDSAEDTVLINTASTTAQAFVSGARANNGLSSTGWARFPPTSEAYDNVWVWSVGRSNNGDPMFYLEKGKSGSPGGTGDCQLISAGGTIPNDSGDDHLKFTLSTRSTSAPTVTGTRTNIEYRAYMPEGGATDINDGAFHHIAVVMSGSDGDLDSNLSASFYVDGIKCFTCKNGTNVVQKYYDRYAASFGSSGFMSYNGATNEAYNFSNTATNPLAVIPNTLYRGDEFISIGGDSSTTIGVSNAFTGAMDQLAFWSRPISDADVTELYNTGAPANITASATYTYDTSALIAWLPLGEGFNALDSDDVDIIAHATGDPVFNSSSHAIWDMSGKQNNFYAINAAHSKADAIEVHFATGAASHAAAGGYNPAHPAGRNDILGYTEKHTYTSGSDYDNFYVQHMIPRSDKQYAFFTSSMVDPNNEFRFTGYMPTSGRMQGMFSSSYTNGVQPFFNFVSMSEIGAYMGDGLITAADVRPGMEYMIGHPKTLAAYNRDWFLSPSLHAADWMPQPCNHLNLNIYEPITGASSTLGWPLSTPLARSNYDNTPTPAAAWPNNDNAIQYRNTTLVSASRDEHGGLGTGKLGIAGHFNMLMFKRNGQYGWTPFAQTHQSDHPVLYDQRKTNVMMMEYNTPGVQQEFPVRPVSLKGRPVRLNYDYETTQILQNEPITTTHNTTLVTSYNNEFIYFNSRSLDNYLDIPIKLMTEITPFEQLLALKHEEGFKLNWVHYTENVYPSLRNEFSPTSSFRFGYDNRMWRDSFDDRMYLANKIGGTQGLVSGGMNYTSGRYGILSNSYGVSGGPLSDQVGQNVGLSASSWPLDAPKAFLTRHYAPMIATFTGSADDSKPFWRVGSLRGGGAEPTGSRSTGSYPSSYLPGFSASQGCYGRGAVPVGPGGIAGELQNTYGWWHQTSSNWAWILPSPTNPDTNIVDVPTWQIGGDSLLDKRIYGDLLVLTLSPAALYARKQTLTSPLSVNPPNYPSLSASVRDFGMSGGIQPFKESSKTMGGSYTYYRFSTASQGAGEAYWDAPDTAGYLSGTIVYGSTNEPIKTVTFVTAASKPWYNDYDDYKENLKLIARGYSVVPEFRISERVENYLKGDIDDFQDFTVPGTEFNSTQKNFYKDFSNSDFMQKFLNIRNISNLHAKEISLTCNAVVKFNPYKGFYPADRTLQLVSQFSKSYANSIEIDAPSISDALSQSINYSPDAGSSGIVLQGAAHRLALQPLFSPGILYNSIKAGVACDWPLVTDGTRLTSTAITGAYPNLNSLGTWENNGINHAWTINPLSATDVFSTGSFWDKRIPFEAIINPGKYMAGVNLIDMEPDPLCSLGQWVDVTASIAAGTTDNLYTLMASNFIAEVGDFFLQSGEYSKLKSKGVRTTSDPMTFPSGAVFGSRLRMRASYTGSRTYEYESGAFGDNTWYTKFGAGGTYLDASTFTDRGAGVTTGSFEIPQDPGQNPNFIRDFVMYSRPTAFGPPFASFVSPSTMRAYYNLWTALGRADTDSQTFDEWQENRNIDMIQNQGRGAKDSIGGYNWAWTPPYYYGEAWCDFIFRPDHTKTYTLENILAETATKFYRADPGPQTSSYAESLAPAIFQLGPGGNTSNSYNFPGDNYCSLISDNARLSGGVGPTNGRAGGKGLSIVANYSPYASVKINQNAMQLSASLNLFGIENIYNKRFDKFGREIMSDRELVGKRWVIQPKFETPMLNFSREGVHPIYPAAPTQEGRTKTVHMRSASAGAAATEFGFGADTAADGMWHQFGIRPEEPNKGIFLEMTDIPDSWLQYHYSVVSESSVYNNYDPFSVGDIGISKLHNSMQSFGDMMGFTDDNAKVRLGELAESRTIKEAIVAVPYIQQHVDPETEEAFSPGTFWKKFINIPKARIDAAMSSEEGSEAGDSLDAAGPSIRRLVDKMQDYVLPPKFDFLRNPLVDPVVMYIFEFEYKLDKDDLSYIWQNLAPRKSKETYFQQDVVAHELFDTELLSEANLMENGDLRWMVFKVKQRSQKTYRDKVLQDYGTWTADPVVEEASISDYKLLYNWPYDYLSIVELVKMEAEVLYKDPMEEVEDILIGEGLIPTPSVEDTDMGMLSIPGTVPSLQRGTVPAGVLADNMALGSAGALAKTIQKAKKGDAASLGKLAKASSAKSQKAAKAAAKRNASTSSEQKSAKAASNVKSGRTGITRRAKAAKRASTQKSSKASKKKSK